MIYSAIAVVFYAAILAFFLVVTGGYLANKYRDGRHTSRAGWTWGDTPADDHPDEGQEP